MIWPVDVRTVTQEFAAYPNPDYQPDGHTGMDFGVNVGTPVRAAGAGTVLWADWAQGLGWPNPYYIAIDFDGPSNGDQSAGIVVVIDHGHCATLYAHLDYTGLNPGDKVAEGEIIGQTGNTGRSSGPHLHFEVLPDGWDVHARWYGRANPRNVISGHAAIAPQSTTTNPEGFLMSLTDKQQTELYDRITKYVDAPISAVDNKVWATPVTRGGKKISALQELADAKTETQALRAAVVALAKNPGLSADQITAAVKAGIADGTVTVDINVNGAV